MNPNIKNIHDFKYSDFKLINYYPQKAIKGKMN
jgi:thymidylate synthase